MEFKFVDLALKLLGMFVTVYTLAYNRVRLTWNVAVR